MYLYAIFSLRGYALLSGNVFKVQNYFSDYDYDFKQLLLQRPFSGLAPVILHSKMFEVSSSNLGEFISNC